ncbi:MAG: peptidoglycan-binding protein [Phycisphaerales bacterium]|nr:peptidoglycan-binding protein [Phycisphaerales bacterium]
MRKSKLAKAGGVIALSSATIFALSGCAACGERTAYARTTSSKSGCKCGKKVAGKPCGTCDSKVTVTSGARLNDCDTTSSSAVAQTSVHDLPYSAAPGDCFVRVFVPEQVETVSERVCVQPESERMEIVPARYEWVEERVMVKPECKKLVEVAPEFEWREECVVLQPAYKSWVMKTDAECTTEDGKPTDSRTVICLVEHPAVTRNIDVRALKKPACVEEAIEPAQYETVRVQKMVEPACAKRVKTPAVYEDIEKTVVIAPSRVEWRRAICEFESSVDEITRAEQALQIAGYDPGDTDGRTDPQFWNALSTYQRDHGLAVGAMTEETMDKLNSVPR